MFILPPLRRFLLCLLCPTAVAMRGLKHDNPVGCTIIQTTEDLEESKLEHQNDHNLCLEGGLDRVWNISGPLGDLPSQANKNIGLYCGGRTLHFYSYAGFPFLLVDSTVTFYSCNIAYILEADPTESPEPAVVSSAADGLDFFGPYPAKAIFHSSVLYINYEGMLESELLGALFTQQEGLPQIRTNLLREAGSWAFTVASARFSPGAQSPLDMTADNLTVWGGGVWKANASVVHSALLAANTEAIERRPSTMLAAVPVEFTTIPVFAPAGTSVHEGQNENMAVIVWGSIVTGAGLVIIFGVFMAYVLARRRKDGVAQRLQEYGAYVQGGSKVSMHATSRTRSVSARSSAASVCSITSFDALRAWEDDGGGFRGSASMHAPGVDSPKRYTAMGGTQSEGGGRRWAVESNTLGRPSKWATAGKAPAMLAPLHAGDDMGAAAWPPLIPRGEGAPGGCGDSDDSESCSEVDVGGYASGGGYESGGTSGDGEDSVYGGEGQGLQGASLDVFSVLSRTHAYIVYFGLWRMEEVAVKSIAFNRGPANRLNALACTEAEIAACLEHQNVTELHCYDVHTLHNTSDGDSTVESLGGSAYAEQNFTNKLYMVQEYCNGGSLRSLLRDPKYKSLDVSQRWGCMLLVLRGVAEGMRYLHTQNFVHGHLSPSRILFQVDKGTVVHSLQVGAAVPKVSDPGSTIGALIREATCSHAYHERYDAPETASGQRRVQSSDVYSYGCIMWDLAQDDGPQECAPTIEAVESLNSSSPSSPQSHGHNNVPARIPQAYKDLATACTASNPAERLVFVQVLDRLKALEEEVASGKYIDALGNMQSSEGLQGLREQVLPSVLFKPYLWGSALAQKVRPMAPRPRSPRQHASPDLAPIPEGDI